MQEPQQNITRIRRRDVVLYGLLTLALLGLWLALSGCSQALYKYGEVVYGVNCRPEVVQANNGKCVYVKEKQHAETPRP